MSTQSSNHNGRSVSNQSKTELLSDCFLGALLEPLTPTMTTSPVKATTNSPSKNAHPIQPASNAQQLSSPRTARTLRKLQSAHQLSSHYASQNNNPSLISQQRQQQHRNPSASLAPPPPVPSLRRSHSYNRLLANPGTPATASIPLQNVTGQLPSAKRGKSPRRPATTLHPKDQLKALVASGPKNDIPASLRDMRYLILGDGVDADNDGMSQLRIYVWLILLNAPALSTDEYLAIVRRGPSPAYAKIRNDTFRTLATDPLFKRRVSEASLIRVLNAIAWRIHDAKQISPSFSPTRSQTTTSETGSPSQSASSKLHASASVFQADAGGGHSGGPSIYLQGMNVLSAPFLYASRSETQAFTAFHLFLTTQIPGYLLGTLDGVHRGCSLISRILRIVDPKLSGHLESKGARAEVYAFASVLTMSACTPPLPEVLRWWDFLVGWGWWLNVVGVVGQLVMMREKLLAASRYVRPNMTFSLCLSFFSSLLYIHTHTPMNRCVHVLPAKKENLWSILHEANRPGASKCNSPGNLLRSFPPLQARKLVDLTVSFVRKIPDDLYDELVHHAE